MPILFKYRSRPPAAPLRGPSVPWSRITTGRSFSPSPPERLPVSVTGDPDVSSPRRKSSSDIVRDGMLITSSRADAGEMPKHAKYRKMSSALAFVIAANLLTMKEERSQSECPSHRAVGHLAPDGPLERMAPVKLREGSAL